MVIDPLQVGCLTAQTWTVVDQLAVNFASRKIDKRHGCPDCLTGSSFIAHAPSESNLQTKFCCATDMGRPCNPRAEYGLRVVAFGLSAPKVRIFPVRSSYVFWFLLKNV